MLLWSIPVKCFLDLIFLVSLVYAHDCLKLMYLSEIYFKISSKAPYVLQQESMGLN